MKTRLTEDEPNPSTPTAAGDPPPDRSEPPARTGAGRVLALVFGSLAVLLALSAATGR